MALTRGEIQQLKNLAGSYQAPPESKGAAAGYFRKAVDAAPEGFKKFETIVEADAAAPEAVAVAASNDPVAELDTLGTPEGGMAFTSLAPMAGVKPDVISSEPEAEPVAAPVSARPVVAPVLARVEETKPDDGLKAASALRDLQNLSLKAADSGGGSSIILTSAAATKIQQEVISEKKRKEDEAFKSELAYIERLREQNKKWQDEIDRNNREKAENETKLEEIEKLKKLKAEGKYDPNDPAQRQMLIDLGIDPATDPNQLNNVLTQKSTVLTNRNTWIDNRDSFLKHKIDQNVNLIDRMDNKTAYVVNNNSFADPQMESSRQDIARRTGIVIDPINPTDDQKEMLLENVLYENMKDTQERKAIQQYDVDDKSTLQQHDQHEGETLSVDQEVENFFKGYAAAEQIQDPELKYQKVKELVDGLSEEAKGNVVMNEDTSSLFDENGNFILKDPGVSVQTANGAVQSNLKLSAP